MFFLGIVEQQTCRHVFFLFFKLFLLSKPFFFRCFWGNIYSRASVFTSIGQSFSSDTSLNVSKWALQSLHTISLVCNNNHLLDNKKWKKTHCKFLSCIVIFLPLQDRLCSFCRCLAWQMQELATLFTNSWNPKWCIILIEPIFGFCKIYNSLYSFIEFSSCDGHPACHFGCRGVIRFALLKWQEICDV